MEQMEGKGIGFYGRVGKRLLDVVLSFLALIPALLLMLPLGLLIKMEDGGPILFRQTRLGRNGKTFSMLKLRSMRRPVRHVQSILQPILIRT